MPSTWASTTWASTGSARTVVALLAVLALALAGCQDGPDDGEAPPDTEGPTDPVTDLPDPGSDPDDPDADGGVEPLTDQRTMTASTEEGAGGLLTVTDVRIGAHAGFDRVVFEIAGEGPAGWHVEYVDNPTTPGQGAPVDIEGEAFLAVFIRGVALPLDAPEHDPWDGERLAGSPGAGVVELVEAGLFEGQHEFFIGLQEHEPFGVVRLENPQRIVVEIDRS